jgi:hypothetical protein
MSLTDNKIINWMDSKKSRPYAYAIVAGVVLSLLIAAYINSYTKNCERRFVGIQATLKHLRASILIFSRENGRYPDSLDELEKFCKDSDGNESWFKMHVDLSSDKRSEIPEHRKLNDKGGYYYNPGNGEVRLNLTRRVKEYLPRYQGVYEDTVPSSW